jgi:hypothetical protein
MHDKLSRMLCAAALLLAACFVATAEAQKPTEPSVRIVVETDKPLQLDRAALARYPVTHYSGEAHGEKATWQGVEVRELLLAAGAPLGEKLRGGELLDVVVVTANDGYRVVFALAEFDAAFGNSGAILAYQRDGKAMDASEGPYRLVVPGERRAGRWVRDR